MSPVALKSAQAHQALAKLSLASDSSSNIRACGASLLQYYIAFLLPCACASNLQFS